MEIADWIMGLIMAVCFILTIAFLIGYVIKRSKSKLRYAAISFVIGVAGPISLIAIEKWFSSYNISNKEEVLVASREASIGGIVLKLYADSTFEVGGLRQVTSTGRFELIKDTLFITSPNTSEGGERFIRTSFLIKADHLQELRDTGIGFLKVHENRLTK